jgi:hypothetical protein
MSTNRVFVAPLKNGYLVTSLEYVKKDLVQKHRFFASVPQVSEFVSEFLGFISAEDATRDCGCKK